MTSLQHIFCPSYYAAQYLFKSYLTYHTIPTTCWIRGGEAHLRWVAPAFGGLLLPSVGCSYSLRWVAPATISQKWSGNRRKGRRHATLWSICCLFCFINFFWFICQNFEKNEFPNSWCKFKKWNGRIFFPKPLWKLFKMGPSR